MRKGRSSSCDPFCCLGRADACILIGLEKSLRMSREEAPPPQVAPPQVEKLLEIMGDCEMSARQIAEALGLSDRKNVRRLYLDPALELGLIEMTIPDKPTSRLQKYRRVANS